MEPLFDFSLEVIRWLQANYPSLAGFFEFVSDAGRFEVYLAILPLIYWCLNKQMGKHLIFLITLSDMTNASLKHFFRGPRPFWLDERVALSSEQFYGVPSGHAQNGSLALLFVAMWLRRAWVWVVAILLVVVMGLSRIYLGMHFVHDVVVALLLAILFLAGYRLWMRYLYERFRNRILGQRLLMVLAGILLLVAVYVVVRVILGEPDMTVPWAEYIEATELESIQHVTRTVGLLFGLGIGFILEVSRVRFIETGPVWKRILRYLVGLAGAVLIVFGLDGVFPEEPLVIGLVLRFFRYFLGGIWASYYAPMLFVRLRLADAHPEPEVRLSVTSDSIMKG